MLLKTLKHRRNWIFLFLTFRICGPAFEGNILRLVCVIVDDFVTLALVQCNSRIQSGIYIMIAKFYSI